MGNDYWHAAMFRLNRLMKARVARIGVQSSQLQDSLQSIADRGFAAVGGAFLMAACQTETNARPSDFPDRTGYECFINSIHVEDYVDVQTLEQALLFVDAVIASWRKAAVSPVLNAIVTAGNDASVVVKFHVLRPDEKWIDDDIEGYSEAILVIDSREESAITSSSHKP